MGHRAPVAERELGDARLIEVEGDLDVSNATLFVDMMLAAATRPGARIVLDLERADFIDSTVLNAIFASASRLRGSEGKLAIVCTKDHLYRVLEAAGVDAACPIVTTREGALKTLGASA
jgi:anti-sigma B factor antagonist